RPDTTVQQHPFPFMVAHGQLPDEVRGDIDRDFPRYASAGFFPYDPNDCGPSVNALVENMTSAAFARAVGQRLGIENLDQYPTLVTLCRLLNKRHGTIHTDSMLSVWMVPWRLFSSRHRVTRVGYWSRFSMPRRCPTARAKAADVMFSTSALTLGPQSFGS